MSFSVEWVPGAAFLMLVGLMCAPVLGGLIGLVAIALVAMGAVAGLAGAIFGIPYLVLRSAWRKHAIVVGGEPEELTGSTELQSA